MRDIPDADYSMAPIAEDGLQGGGFASQEGDFTGTIIYAQCDD